MIKTTIATFFLFFSSLLFSQSIMLDDSFGINGLTVLNGDTNGYSVINSKIQTDGKILVTGHFNDANGDYEYFLTRLNSDGSLDTNFATNGYFILPFTLDPFNVRIHLLNDKIFIISLEDRQILKLNSNGTVDTSFGTNGLLSYSLENATSSNGSSVKIINDLFYHGYVINNNQVTLKRIDLINSTVLTNLNINGISNIEGLYEGSNNNLLIKSYDEVNYQTFFSLHSIVTGNIDNTFGNNGKIESYVYTTESDFNNSYDYIELDNANNIIHGEVNENNLTIRVQKYSATGQLITSFATNGLYQFTNAVLSDMKTLNDKIYLQGVSTLNSELNLFVNRLNADGSIDTTFNSGQVYIQNSNPTEEIAESLNVISESEFIIAGEYIVNSTTNKIFVGKYKVDTSLSLSNENSSTQDIKIINPVTEDLVITTNEEFYKVEVYSTTGKLIKSLKTNEKNVSDLPNGNYLLNIFFKNGTVLKHKILIM